MSTKSHSFQKVALILFCFLFAMAIIPLLSAPESSETEMDKVRLQQISPVPASDADHVFGIESIKPGWEGMGGSRVIKDYFGKGADALDVIHSTSSNASLKGAVAYWQWTVKNIEKDKYYIGLWVETSCAKLRTEFNPTSLTATAYLNGWPVRFSTTSDPVQVRPGIWLAELQSEHHVEIKNGDEIAMCPANGAQIGDSKKVYRLALHKKEPKRGHGVTGQTFGIQSGVSQRVRLSIVSEITGSGEDGAKHVARIKIGNPLPYSVEADVSWKLADYYGTPLTKKTQRIKLDPHKAMSINHEFTASGNAKAYKLDVHSTPAPGFTLPIKRPMELLTLSDFARIEFIPNLPDPLSVRSFTRKNIINDRTGDRRTLSLNGDDWEESTFSGKEPLKTVPENLDFKPCKGSFRGRKLPKDCFGRCFRKKFTVPEWMRGEKYLIEIGRFSSEATLFINGKLIGSQVGCQELPAAFDVSKDLKLDGENTITVCVRGPIALTNAEFTAKGDFSSRKPILKNSNYPICYAKSRPTVKSVLLRTAPAFKVSNCLVIADVDNQKLKVMTRIENMSNKERKANLKLELFHGGEKIQIDTPAIELNIGPNELKEYNAEINLAASPDINKLTPYTPKNPTISKIVAKLADNDKILDTFNKRFGYRTVKVKGDGLTLNGKPVRFLGASWYKLSSVLEGETGVDIERSINSYPTKQWNVDWSDELGLLTYIRNSVDDTHSWKILNNDPYWKRMRDRQIELTWHYGSKPSVAAWDLSNESYHYAALHKLGEESVIRHGERIASLADEVKKKIWPDYLFFADGDWTLGDRIDFCSFHYKNYSLAYNSFWRNPEKPYQWTPEGVSTYPPDCHFFNNAKNITPKGSMWGGKPQMERDWKYGSCPSGDTETIWFTDRANATGMSIYIGDKASVSTNWLVQSGRGMFFAKQLLEGLKDVEQTLIAPCSWMDFLNPIWQDVMFSMPEQEIRYYSGSRFDRRINIHDDEYKPGTLNFKWKLIDPTGKTVIENDISAQSTTAFIKRDRITFDIPKVDKRSKFRLVMELWKDGAKRAYEDRILDIWPVSAKKLTEQSTITVYDPKNMAVPVLEKMGYDVKKIEKLDKKSLVGIKNLIIGPDCMNESMLSSVNPIRSFVENGGRLLLLHQNDSTLDETGVKFKSRAWFSTGFVRSSEHPVMKGLEDIDFQMWNPGHLMSKGNYIKPNKGSYIPLVDAGYQGTMTWTPMLEIYLGTGSILATQFPLTEAFDTEPMCSEMLKRSIKYFDEPLFRSPEKQLAIIKGASDPVLKRLKETRVEFIETPSADSKHPVTLLDLGSAAKVPDIKSLRDYLNEGGTLIAHQARPEHKRLLEKLTGKSVEIKAQPYQSWVDRQMLDHRDGLATGMNNLDIFWRPLVAGCTWASKMQISCGIPHGKGQVQYVVKIPNAKEYFFPGGLTELKLGKGRLIVNQLKWEMPERDMLCGSPSRYLSILLSNLGIKRTLPKGKPSPPKNAIYEAIDIKAFANLSFKDDKAGDGTGWMDWGPGKTLGKFPTGKTRKFNRVPFLVPEGENNAITLRVNPAWVPSLGKYPERIEIPINKSKIAGFWFLHTGGWITGKGSFGSRIIEYSDGSTEIISIDVNNIADWNVGRNTFPDEEETRTTVAWKGTCEKVPVTRVYQTYWQNPYPEKEIKKLILSNEGFNNQRFIALLGLTSARENQKSDSSPATKEAARNTKKSQALFKDALALIKNGKQTEAETKLREAIKVDKRNPGAWSTLCELRAKTDDLKTFRTLWRQWVELVPNNQHAHNLMAKYLEERNMLEEALSEYEKSLEIFWNQPPISAAITRIKNKLKK